jgi:predicted nucleic acid-binding protein
MSRTLKLVPLAALAALAATGCGGQSQSGSAGQSQPAAALVAAADPICERVATNTATANQALRAVSRSTAKTLRVLERVAPGIASEERRAVAALGALKQSGSPFQRWRTMLVDMRQLANRDAQLAAAAKAENIAAISRIVAAGVPIQKQLTAIAERGGFIYCGHAN